MIIMSRGKRSGSVSSLYNNSVNNLKKYKKPLDKPERVCYNKYIIKERGAWMMLDLELDLDFGSAENTNELFCVGA